MPTTKASQKAVNKYMKANYDRINLTVPKGRQADIKAFAEAQGESVNGLINGLLRGVMGLSEDEWKRGE
jgi:hypothetical protein